MNDPLCCHCKEPVNVGPLPKGSVAMHAVCSRRASEALWAELVTFRLVGERLDGSREVLREGMTEGQASWEHLRRKDNARRGFGCHYTRFVIERE